MSTVNMPSSVSIVIPAFNAHATIEKVIRAALAQSEHLSIEVIVVDDGSTDETARIVKFFKKVSYVYQMNAGPAAARNRGAQASQGEIIFFIDSDCIAHPDWMEKILPHFSDPKVAVVCGSYGIANPKSRLATCIHQEILFRHHRMPRNPKVFGSYNVAFRKEIFNEVGGFLSHYRQASGEDNDLSYRILQAGYQIRFEPTALVDHFHPTRIGQYLQEQFRHGFWRARMYLDHPRMVRGDDYTFWKDAIEVPLSFIAGVFGLVYLACLIFCPGNFGSRIFRHLGTFGCENAGLLFWGSLLALFSLEIYFGFRILGLAANAFFYSGVMGLRSLSRSAGFFWGMLRFLPEKMRSQ